MCKFCKTKIESSANDHSCVANLNEQILNLKRIVEQRKENIVKLNQEKDQRAKALNLQQQEERNRVLNLLSLLNPVDFENMREHIISTHFDGDRQIEEEKHPLEQIVRV